MSFWILHLECTRVKICQKQANTTIYVGNFYKSDQLIIFAPLIRIAEHGNYW